MIARPQAGLADEPAERLRHAAAGSTSFDVVIFDEASQVTLEEAVPSLFRAKQVIVVGDEMQLPPTNFFASRGDGRRGADSRGGRSGQTVAVRSEQRQLSQPRRPQPAGDDARLALPQPSRIADQLLELRLLPGPAADRARESTLPPDAAAEIVVRDAADGAANVDRAARPAREFHFLEHGRLREAPQPRRGRLHRPARARPACTARAGLSIGIIAFSEAQQDEIEQALQPAGPRGRRLSATGSKRNGEREEDGQFVGLLVKNLENIQGDERDVIILSVCYGHGPNGKMLMNFGPINQSGGEKRLNVAFSRAKQAHGPGVSSIRHPAITNDYNDGAER